MKNVLKLIMITCAGIFIAGAGITAGYLYFAEPGGAGQPNIENYALNNEALYYQSVTEQITPTSEVVPSPTAGGEVLVRDTAKIIYEYLYEVDGHVETSEETAPYFLIGSTQKKVEEIYNDWEINLFSEDEIRMRKVVKGKNRKNYILGIFNGYVAVFYQEEINGTNLKEITDTPVSALSPDERQRLQSGIEVFGDDNLVKIMEDYSS